jgi:hypothetical protein
VFVLVTTGGGRGALFALPAAVATTAKDFGSRGGEGSGGGAGGVEGGSRVDLEGVVATGGTKPFGWNGGAVALSFELDTRGGGVC